MLIDKRSRLLYWPVLLGLLLDGSGCSAILEPALRSELAEVALARKAEAEQPSGTVEGTLAQYLALALRRHPRLAASFARWRAAVLSIDPARQLPEPTLHYGVFLQSVETRVGPQRHRLSLQQTLPWPTRLTAGADAAAARARALQRSFDAEVLMVRATVAESYYRLWMLRRLAAIQGEQLELLEGLSASVGARLSTGSADLADLQQIDLARVRLADAQQSLQAQALGAEAQLRAAVGAGPEIDFPTQEAPPPLALPAETRAELFQAARRHPRVLGHEQLEVANQALARSEGARRWPSLTLALDWIEVGPAAVAGVSDSGKDAVVLGVGLSLPLWQGSYSDRIAAAEAEAVAQQAEGQAVADQNQAQLAAVLAELDNAVRQAQLHRQTLRPQARAAYDSVIGRYIAGRGAVADAVLAQRELLEVCLGLARARAAQAIAWARLERIVGREVARQRLSVETPEGADG